MIQFKENVRTDRRTEGRKDRTDRKDKPYFIGSFRLPPGVQKIRPLYICHDKQLPLTIELYGQNVNTFLRSWSFYLSRKDVAINGNQLPLFPEMPFLRSCYQIRKMLKILSFLKAASCIYFSLQSITENLIPFRKFAIRNAI